MPKACLLGALAKTRGKTGALASLVAQYRKTSASAERIQPGLWSSLEGIFVLFILTGDIQIGKTRWLQAVVKRLEEQQIQPFGVLAPGTWIEHRDNNHISYEKTGIDNELLPSHELISFARRDDLISREEMDRTCTQSAGAQLAWAIDDSAIKRVNDHFATFKDSTAQPGRGLVVVDEFGRLELLRNEGLTEALAVIDRGATPAYPHALIIVREQLIPEAKQRFAKVPWGGLKAISPDDSSIRLLFSAYNLAV